MAYGGNSYMPFCFP